MADDPIFEPDEGDDAVPPGMSEEDLAWEDAFIERNGDALNEMLLEAEREYAAKGPSKRTLDQIVAAVLERHGR